VGVTRERGGTNRYSRRDKGGRNYRIAKVAKKNKEVGRAPKENSQISAKKKEGVPQEVLPHKKDKPELGPS